MVSVVVRFTPQLCLEPRRGWLGWEGPGQGRPTRPPCPHTPVPEPAWVSSGHEPRGAVDFYRAGGFPKTEHPQVAETDTSVQRPWEWPSQFCCHMLGTQSLKPLRVTCGAGPHLSAGVAAENPARL